MGLFRLAARVGCWRGGATRPLEEWPHSLARKSAMDRTRLTGPLASLRSQWRSDFSNRDENGEAE